MYFVVMAMVVVGLTCVERFALLCTSISYLWARMCNYCLWPFDQHAKLSWQLYWWVVCVCTVPLLMEHYIMQIQPKGDLFLEAIFTGC